MPGQRRWQPNKRLVHERERRGWSQADAARAAEQVANRLGFSGLVFTDAQLGRWERGEHRPRPPYLRVVCELYQASAEALGLCDPPGDADSPSSATDKVILVPAVGLAPAGRSRDAVSSLVATFQEVAPGMQDQEVTTTDRREAMKHMIAVGAGLAVGGPLLADAADASAAASRRRALSSVDPMTLEDLDQDVERFARDYHSTPHAHLFPQVWEDWLHVERSLDGRQRLRDRAHLTLLAGQLTFFLARLSFHMGGYAAARKHAVLAWQYAEDVEQPLLCASVRVLQSSSAFYAGQYQKTLDLLRSAEPFATPYTRSRLAAYEARTYAILGDRASAERALGRMERQLVDAPVEPGESPFTAATATLWLAGTYARLGDGEAAEGYAREAIALYDSSRPRGEFFSDRGHARLNLAASLVARRQPDPEEAARLGTEAVGVPEGQRNDTVRKRAGELWELLADWRATPAVKEFGDRLREYRPLALPAPTA